MKEKLKVEIDWFGEGLYLSVKYVLMFAYAYTRRKCAFRANLWDDIITQVMGNFEGHPEYSLGTLNKSLERTFGKLNIRVTAQPDVGKVGVKRCTHLTVHTAEGPFVDFILSQYTTGAVDKIGVEFECTPDIFMDMFTFFLDEGYREIFIMSNNNALFINGVLFEVHHFVDTLCKKGPTEALTPYTT